MSSPRTIKLADIAKEAGVSIATASKVMNGRPDVSEVTRAKVERIMRKTGYSKSLANSTPGKSIEVILEKIDSVWTLEVLQGVSDMAQRHGLSITLTLTGSFDNDDYSWIYGTLERRPAGVIYVLLGRTEHDKTMLATRNIPFVTLDSRGDASPDEISLRADNWTGGLIATRHLLSLGHTRIGVICGPADMTCALARYNGYLSALEEAGLPVDPSLKRTGNYTEKDGKELALSLLKSPAKRPTAIFAGDDLQAMGVYEAARQLGLSIPEDLSVMGFDNIRTSAYLGPALTTVEQPISLMAQRAVETILDIRAGREVEHQAIFSTKLIKRDSTAAPQNHKS